MNSALKSIFQLLICIFFCSSNVFAGEIKFMWEDNIHRFPDASSVTPIKLGVKPPHVCGLLIQGDITETLKNDFHTYLNSKVNPDNCELDNNSNLFGYDAFKTVTLRGSRGGDLNAAFDIMKSIRKHKLITQIDASFTNNKTENGYVGCFSSCALIFASGFERHFTEKYKHTIFKNGIPHGDGKSTSDYILGIHKPDLSKGTYDYLNKEKYLDELKYKIISFLNENGIDARFTIKMFETSHENIFYPTLEDLLIGRVVTSLDEPEVYKGLFLRQEFIESASNRNVFLADYRENNSIILNLHHYLNTNVHNKETFDYQTTQHLYNHYLMGCDENNKCDEYPKLNFVPLNY